MNIYIFIHSFVYSFASSLNTHFVRLCCVVPSIMGSFFWTQKQSSVDNLIRTAATAAFLLGLFVEFGKVS